MILWRYIVKAHLGPFIFGTVVIIFLFLTQFLMKWLGDLTSKGLDNATIIEFIVLNISWILVLAIPIGVLFATVMAFGSLSSTAEVTVMKASGMGLFRMMMPVLILGTAMWWFTFWYTDNILPDTNHRLSSMMSDIQRLKPTFAIEAGKFSTDIDGFTILARNLTPAGEMLNVTIYDHSRSDRLNIVSADTGRLAFSPSLTKLVLDLHNGEVHQSFRNAPDDYRIIQFRKHQMTMPVDQFFLERSDMSSSSRGEREMRISDMQRIVNRSDSAIAVSQATTDSLWKMQFAVPGSELTAPPSKTEAINRAATFISTSRVALEGEANRAASEQETINRYEVEIHKKYAIPFACLLFVLVGCPLGILTKGGNFGLSAAICLVCYIAYWMALMGGETLADRGLIQPMIAMWLGNGIFLAVGSAATYVVNNR